MFNAQKPSLDELPSSAQLLRSTIIAIAVAVLILLTVILPAEYGLDPTGMGKVLGLTEMGEIKRGLTGGAGHDHSEIERDEAALSVALKPRGAYGFS